eukprot:gene4982-3577_t
MLAKPETQKFSSIFETSHLRVGCCSMQGWRKTMEDAHIAQLNIDNDKKKGFFAAARFCSTNLFGEFQKACTAMNNDVEAGFIDAFRSMDALICKKYHFSGATANCIYLVGNKLYCANAGDCRSVFDDHKPTLPSEEARITKAGCQVENGRVNMRVAVSRAFGDVEFKDNDKLSWKDQAITALPDVTCYEMEPQDQFIIMGCDGIWDAISNEDACDLVQSLLKNQEEMETFDISLVCEHFLDKCLAPTNTETKGTDNMSIIIVQFKPPFFQPLILSLFFHLTFSLIIHHWSLFPYLFKKSNTKTTTTPRCRKTDKNESLANRQNNRMKKQYRITPTLVVELLSPSPHFSFFDVSLHFHVAHFPSETEINNETTDSD